MDSYVSPAIDYRRRGGYLDELWDRLRRHCCFLPSGGHFYTHGTKKVKRRQKALILALLRRPDGPVRLYQFRASHWPRRRFCVVWNVAVDKSVERVYFERSYYLGPDKAVKRRYRFLLQKRESILREIHQRVPNSLQESRPANIY